MAPFSTLFHAMALISLVSGADALRGAAKLDEPNEPRARLLMKNDDKYNDREIKQNQGQSSQQDATDEVSITVEYGTFTQPPVSTTQPPVTTAAPVETTTTVAETTTTIPPATTVPPATTAAPITTAAAPITTTTQPPNPSGNCPTTPFDTIVIGAGMAGLSAAHELDKAGLSYIILERSDRVGGRMMSKDFAGEKVELGANWITGGGRQDFVNPILELADEFGMMYYDQADYDQADSANFIGYEKDSQIPVDEKTAQNELKALQKAVECVGGISEGDWGKAIKADFKSAPAADMSARQALEQCKWIKPAPGSFREALECWWLNSDFLMSPEKTSTYNFGDTAFWDFGPENNFVKDKRGVEFIAQEFARTRGLLNNTQFGKEVTGIDYLNDPNALATVTTPGCVYQAKTIVFTPSLEVTRKMEENGVFNPLLTPGSARSPLEAKSWVRVFFKFNVTFWDSDVQQIFIGAENRNAGEVWMNYDQTNIYPGSQIISCVLDQGSLDAILGGAEMSEDFARTNLLKPLRATYSGFVEPTDVLISDWENDPTSYGSWENYPLGKDLVGYYEYFKPRNNKLFISGSGGCLRAWGFMHGAWFAGKRDAEWAIATMNKNGITEPPYSYCDDMGDI